MNENQNTNEFSFKRSSHIIGYLQKFTSTEKAIFGIFFICALVTALTMAYRVNWRFLVEVPAPGGELREGAIGLPRTINPVIAVTDIDRDIVALVYTGLTKYENGKILPSIAKSWDISDDGLVYTFNLPSNIYFQDNKQLTSEDVAFTIQKIQDPVIKSPHRADWVNVSVKVLSPTQIQFTLKQPYAPFLANTTIGIIPKHVWSNVSNEQFIFSQYNTNPIGSGPYKIDSIDHDKGGIPTQYTLTTWSKYKDKKPYLSSIVMKFFADTEKSVEALEKGDVDSVSAISPAEADQINSDSAQDHKVLSSPLPRIFSVFLNQSQLPAFSDIAVRRALDLSIDRDEMVNKVLSGYGKSIHGPLPDLEVSTSTAASFAHSDIPRAQALLELNGWKKNSSGIYEKRTKSSVQSLSFDIYTADTADLKASAELLKASWTKLGAQVGIKFFEASDLYQSVIRTRKYDALLFGQFVGKDQDIYAFWHSSQRNAPGLNVALYTNGKVDTLLESIRSTHDNKTLDTLYTQLNNLILADMPALFLYSPDFIYVVPKTLRNIKLDHITVPSDRWGSVSDWYMNTDRVWSIFVKN